VSQKVIYDRNMEIFVPNIVHITQSNRTSPSYDLGVKLISAMSRSQSIFKLKIFVELHPIVVFRDKDAPSWPYKSILYCGYSKLCGPPLSLETVCFQLFLITAVALIHVCLIVLVVLSPSRLYSSANCAHETLTYM